jgi:glycosyltransferase involved in cell wall biosynthesis
LDLLENLASFSRALWRSQEIEMANDTAELYFKRKPITNIAVVSVYDVNDTNVWSGLPYFIVSSLRIRPDLKVHSYAPLIQPSREVQAKMSDYHKKGQYYLWTRDLRSARAAAVNAVNKLSGSSIQHIVVFNPSDAAFLETPIPITIIIDATWKQYVDGYYRYETATYCEETKTDGLVGETLGFERAAAIVCLTPWAAEGVKREYPAFRNKVEVVLPGANLEKAPARREIVENIRLKASSNRRSLLFVGSSPYRKGVDIAIQTCAILRGRGLDFSLDVAGFNMPSTARLPQFVRHHGYLAKADAGRATSFSELFSEAHAFLLPTRAECAGIVLCEAAAYGLPALVSGVGGTSALVLDQCTGTVVGERAPGSKYANAISWLFDDKARYTQVALAARERFETRLNWTVFVNELLKILAIG